MKWRIIFAVAFCFLLPMICSAQSSTLVSAVTNFGIFGDPNDNYPSNQWPYGTVNSFDYLWEGRYWVGAVVNGVRHVSHADYSSGYEWHDIRGLLHDEYTILGITTFADTCIYTDMFPQAEHFPLGLQVDQIVSAFPAGEGPDEAFLILQTLRNAGGYNLDSVYIAWVFDYDVASGDLTNCNIDDWASYQPQRSLGYMWDGDDPAEPGDDTGDYGLSLGYTGIALLEAPLPLCSFQWWNWNDDPSNDDEMFQFMAGIHPASGGYAFRPEPDSVQDYRVLISTGPYTLFPGEFVQTASTFAVGDSMDGLEAAVDEMALWYHENITSVLPDPFSAPHDVAICHAQPNPFNSSTALSYQLQAASPVSLKVYDTAGRLVATLAEGMQEAGMHQMIFDGSNLPSGVYLYHLASGVANVSGKMVLLK
jgi:hypothetical protein